jgi:outer membrane lipoprotein carrier protein
MRKTWAAVILLLVIGSDGLWGQTHGADARKAAAVIDARYNGMKSLRADFTESYSGGGIRRNESGTLWIKKPGKMRWDYLSPQKKVFVTDGSAAWFYITLSAALSSWAHQTGERAARSVACARRRR